MIKFAIEDKRNDDIVVDFITELESITEFKFNLMIENITLEVFGKVMSAIDEKIKDFSEDKVSRMLVTNLIINNF